METVIILAPSVLGGSISSIRRNTGFSLRMFDYEDPSEVSENESPTSTLSPETHESTRNSSDTSVIQTESADDQNETESRS